jgi:hypothetical protein
MSGYHLSHGLLLCVRDEDAKTFAFHSTTRDGTIMSLVAHAVTRGRRLRCHRLAGGDEARRREERFLLAKGYRPAAKIV